MDKEKKALVDRYVENVRIDKGKLYTGEMDIREGIGRAIKNKNQEEASRLFDELTKYRKNTELFKAGKKTGTKLDAKFNETSSKKPEKRKSDKKEYMDRLSRSLAKLKIKD